jgi:hypothetical protein
MPRVCFLHAGTHKTGTKYLQSFLRRNEYALASDGLYIPVSGKASQGAHHNIAWELAGDRRYNPALGTLKELMAELSSVQMPRVCVSSEDFEFLYKNVHALRVLRSKLNEIAYCVKVLFFLRPQADYAESIYAEFVKQGSILDFPEFLDLFTKAKLDEGLTPDYNLLLEPFADVFGLENVIVRPFRDSDRPELILIDFLSQMLPRVDLRSGKYRIDRARENASIPFFQVFQLFVRNNLAPFSEALQIDPVSLAKSIQSDIGGHRYLYGPFDPICFVDVVTRFWNLGISNLRVLRKYGVFIPFVSGKAFRKHLLALFGFDVNSRKRRNLIKTFVRNSDHLRAVLNELGQQGSSREGYRPRESATQSTIVAPDYLENLPVGFADEMTPDASQLSSELAHWKRELRATRQKTAQDIAERDREIDCLKTELLSLQERLNKAPFSAGRIGSTVKHALIVRPGSGIAACFVGARRCFSTFRSRRLGQTIASTGLFDSSFYLMQKPELKGQILDPLAHFLEHGAKASRDPHPLFDTSYYLERNPDIVRAGINPLLHFIKFGAQEGRDPHPLFELSYYLEQNFDIAHSGANALVHFLTSGAYEGRNPCPLFDVSYYLEQNPEVAKARLNPLVHFVQGGAYEGRDPHPLFSTSYYLERNPEVAMEGLNPLVHFIQFGVLQGRNPHPLFDISYYRQHNSDLEGPGFNPALHFLATVNPLVHFLRYGVHKGRDPHPLFDTSYYLEKNPDIVREGLNPLVHFLRRGAYEGRDPSPLFNLSHYLERNPEVARSRVNPLVHFIICGERNRPEPVGSPPPDR